MSPTWLEDLRAGKETRPYDTNVSAVTGETRITIKGKLIFTTPKVHTKTIQDAAKWYREEFSKIGNAIDKDLPIELQILQSEQLEKQLMNGAVASLFDDELAITLREAFVRPSIEKLKAEIGGAGEKQLKLILEKMKELSPERKWFEPGACFAAGTLVHTKEGLVPIEQIKVGDWVLSKPENGGEQAYKRVLKTFAHEPTVVMEVCYTKPDNARLGGGRIISTTNHPFWVVDKGWTAAGDLPQGFNANGSKFETNDGGTTFIRGCGSIYVSDTLGVGWTPAHMGDLERPGNLWDYVNHKLIATDVMAIDKVQALELDHPLRKQIALEEAQKSELNNPYLKLPVYNLEVEDFHTYYVGKLGVWVHNTNCGGLSFEVKPPAPDLPEAMTTNPHISRKQLIDSLEAQIPDLASRERFTDTLLVRADEQSQYDLIDPADIKKQVRCNSQRRIAPSNSRLINSKTFYLPIKRSKESDGSPRSTT